MKLRLNGDSVRLRLGPREVQRLVDAGRLDEQTRFAPGDGGGLRYTLELSPEAADVSAAFDGGRLRVTLPTAVAHRWAAAADEVALRGGQDVGDGRRLSVLVEKDFECLHGEDAGGAQRGDAFPNPATTTTHSTPPV